MFEWFELAQFTSWLSDHWFDLTQTLGIIFGFVFTLVALKRDSNERKLQNYLLLTEYHRDVWGLTLTHPEIRNAFESISEAESEKLTPDQRQFLTFVFTHISCTFEMNARSSLIKIENLEEDIADLLSSPKVLEFWNETKRFHNRRFVAYVDKCAKRIEPSRTTVVSLPSPSDQPKDGIVQVPVTEQTRETTIQKRRSNRRLNEVNSTRSRKQEDRDAG